MGQEGLSGRCDCEFEPTLGQASAQALELNGDDAVEIGLGECVESDDLIDPVHELRLEVLDRLAGDVGRHDQHCVGEVHRASLAVSQPTVLEHLEQCVEHVGMGLLQLIEEHHGIGPTADGLGQLAALFVTDVAGRSPDETRH